MFRFIIFRSVFGQCSSVRLGRDQLRGDRPRNARHTQLAAAADRLRALLRKAAALHVDAGPHDEGLRCWRIRGAPAQCDLRHPYPSGGGGRCVI